MIAVLLLGCTASTSEPRDDGFRSISPVPPGGAQSATVLSSVAIAPAVLVTDSKGVPVAGATVIFTVTAGGGTVRESMPATTAAGIASSGQWTLSSTAGRQVVSARVNGASNVAHVTFEATATPGPATTMTLSSSLVLLRIADTLTILATVRDAHGNAISTPPLFASADGAVASVTPNGKLTGVAAGSTSVSVEVEGIRRDARVGIGSAAPVFAVTTSTFGGSLYGATISPTGFAYITRPGDLLRLDLRAETASAPIPGGSQPLDVTILPNGTRAYVADLGQVRVHVVSVPGDSLLGSLYVGGAPVRVRASPDGRYVVASTNNSRIVRIHVGTHALDTLALTGAFEGLALSPNGSRAYVTNAVGMIHEIDLATFTRIRSRSLGSRRTGIAVSPDGRRLFVGGPYSPITVLDASTLDQIIEIPESVGAFDVAISPDGRFVFSSLRYSSLTIAIFDAHNFALHRSIGGSDPRGVAVAPDGSVAIVTNATGWVTFIR